MGRSAGLGREQVVAAAAELADAHGLEALTLAQVAARLGVKLPSLYHHVEGLPGLRRELALLAARELEERVARAAIGRSGEAALLALAGAYRDYVRAHPGRYAATVRAPDADDAELTALSERLVGVVLAALAPYGLADDEAIHAVRGLRSLVHGFATLEAGEGFGIPLDRDESFRRLMGAYLAGLGAFSISGLRP